MGVIGWGRVTPTKWGVGVSLFGWVNQWRRVVPSIGGGWLAVVGWVVSRWGLFVVAEWWPRVTAYRAESRGDFQTLGVFS